MLLCTIGHKDILWYVMDEVYGVDAVYLGVLSNYLIQASVSNRHFSNANTAIFFFSCNLFYQVDDAFALTLVMPKFLHVGCRPFGCWLCWHMTNWIIRKLRGHTTVGQSVIMHGMLTQYDILMEILSVNLQGTLSIVPDSLGYGSFTDRTVLSTTPINAWIKLGIQNHFSKSIYLSVDYARLGSSL